MVSYWSNKEEWPDGLWEEWGAPPPDEKRCQFGVGSRDERCGLPAYHADSESGEPRCLFHYEGEDRDPAELRPALEDAVAKGATLGGANLPGADLRDANLQRAKLWGANLQKASLRRVNLHGANLSDAKLQGADLEDASLETAYLEGASLQKTHLWYANLQQADLGGAHLQGAGLWCANLQEANLRDALLQEANLGRANLQKASLYDANLQGADLSHANLQEAHLPSTQLQRADLWCANLQEANLRCANLQEANLKRADLQEANLYDANLQEADIEGAKLQGANLERADLREANLTHANLQEANLYDANLQGADLRRARLIGAVDLRGADLTNASLLGFELSPEAKLDNVNWGLAAGNMFPDEREARSRRPLDESAFAECEALYRQIKLSYQNSGDYGQGGQFFIREMECKRTRLRFPRPVPEGRLKALWARLIRRATRPLWWVCYQICEHGENPARLAGVMGLVIVLFAFIHSLVGVDGSDREPVIAPGFAMPPLADLPAQMTKALYFSVATFTSLGYGDMRPVEGWGQVVAMVEVSLGIILVALLVGCVIRKLSR